MKRRIAFIAQGLELDVQEADNRTAWAIYDNETSEQLTHGEDADFDTAADTAVAELNNRLVGAHADR